MLIVPKTIIISAGWHSILFMVCFELVLVVLRVLKPTFYILRLCREGAVVHLVRQERRVAKGGKQLILATSGRERLSTRDA